ncbi:hypothetical protein GCM10027429_26790 [Marivirga atlantica]|jgi:hypothetical protein|uniref:DUF1573 domain-containing protein n=1 Tax=Marivirga atlantica TaxID=1548457 RepID=A0A937DKI8_9BACT|nr:DUF1573 domain-containing protein [Marivirga atlantica]MBL0766281.1 DUF1573 domain-containing protein [Marivirga atlantica]
MKKLAFLFLLFIGVTASYAQTAEKNDGPEITFNETTFDFGDIKQGDVVEHIFTFENTGNQPLIISNATTTCGCTASEYKRGEPIAPGESSQIKVKFNSRGKMGAINKVVTIKSNIGEDRKISIKTNVLPSDS